MSPAKPGEMSYSELVRALSKHYKPAPSEIVERFKFHSWSRRPGESVATFVAELRSLADFCNFGDTLEVMLRDRIVCGINDDAIQKRLLSESGLDYAKAVQTALNMETAAQSVRELKKSESLQSTTPAVHNTSASPSVPTCFRCGTRGHTVANCRVDGEVVCHRCGKRGHLQRVCKSKKKPPPPKFNPTKRRKSRKVGRLGDEEDEESEEEIDEEECNKLFHVAKGPSSINAPPIKVKVRVDECVISMEVDTGAAMSLMSEATFSKLWPGRELHPSQVRLQTYSKEPLTILGCCNVNVCYQGQTAKMPLQIIKGSGPTLMGRDWLSRIRLDWSQIHHLHTPSLHALLERFPNVFGAGLGTLRGYQAKIHVEPGAVPKFKPARTVPYALRDKVDQELQRLQDEGILEPVEIAEWAAPIVVVLKRDKSSIRLCGDFSVTVNPVSKLDRYPIPRINDLFAKLAKGKLFSKLDLSHAYQQLPLEEESRKYVVINTHKGLFRFTRLPFGISSAPGIFQRVMESLLQGIEGVVVYLDDILVTGSTEEAHLKALEEVLSRLERAGLKVKRSKCVFMRPSVTYLGHVIDADGLHPLKERVRAIKEAPTPRSVPELKSHLGMLSYYSKFLPNLSSTLHPLYDLLKKDVNWRWGAAQEKAFAASKKLLTSSNCLTHFDSTLDLTLACDASS